MSFDGTIDYFRDTVFNYPTMAECYKVAALDGLNKLSLLTRGRRSGCRTGQCRSDRGHRHAPSGIGASRHGICRSWPPTSGFVRCPCPIPSPSSWRYDQPRHRRRFRRNGRPAGVPERQSVSRPGLSQRGPTITDFPESLAAVVADPERDLTEIEGIGKDLAEKIAELVKSGKLPMLEELRAQIPAGVMALLRIPGLGPKKAATLFKELNITSLDMLRAACEADQVSELKGFGAKTQEKILAGIDFACHADERMYWAEADEIVQELLAHMRQLKGVRANRSRRQLSPRQGDDRRPRSPGRHAKTPTP